jgi:Ca2+-binding RTX toxin-like protein
MPRITRSLALVPVTMLIAGVLSAPAAAATPRCLGVKATIVGTNHNDVIQGTKHSDVIVALGGADQIKGGGRGDLMCGGDGADWIKGGDGLDFIVGGAGNDTLHGNGGYYDQIVPGPGDDYVNSGSQGTGAGDEVWFLDSPNGVVVDLDAQTATGEGNDTIIQTEWVIGSAYDDTMTGTDGYNVFYGSGGNDVLNLLGGDDGVAGGPGDDTIDGGEGVDFIDEYQLSSFYGDPAPDGITVDFVAGTLTGYGNDSIAGLELSGGTPGDDVMIGDDGENQFIFQGPGDDTIDGAGGDDVIDGGDGADDLDGGSGTDVVGFIDASDGLTIDLEAGTTSQGDALAGFENVLGSFYDDTITGDEAANTIEGADGADTIFGLGGDDVLWGGWSDPFDDGSVDSTDGGPGTDQCDAETETNCESDPAPSTTSSLESFRGLAVRLAQAL